MTCFLEIKALLIGHNKSAVVTMLKPWERPPNLSNGELKCGRGQLALCAFEQRQGVIDVNPALYATAIKGANDDDNNDADFVRLTAGCIEDNRVKDGRGVRIHEPLSNRRTIEFDAWLTQDKI